MFCMEVGRPSTSTGPPFKLPPVPLPVPQDGDPSDFPVSLTVDEKDSLGYLLTKAGTLYVVDILTARTIYRGRITQGTVFATIPAKPLSDSDSDSNSDSAGGGGGGGGGGGILAVVARTGVVLRLGLNRPQVVPYVLATLRDADLAVGLAGRLNLPGAEELYEAEFTKLLGGGDVTGAARLARR